MAFSMSAEAGIDPLYERALDGTIGMFPQEHVEEILAVYLMRRYRNTTAKLISNPAWFLSLMNARGGTKMARLADANREHLAGASTVADVFDIPVSTLHNWKKTGKAIAFRLPGRGEDLFPIAQFSRGAVAPWAAEIVSALGNGEASFHFLCVPRVSLGHASLAQKAFTDSAIVGKLITTTLHKRVAE
jgi:hypothetical protein